MGHVDVFWKELVSIITDSVMSGISDSDLITDTGKALVTYVTA